MEKPLVCNRYLRSNGNYLVNARYCDGRWDTFEVLGETTELPSVEYLVEGLPVDLHCHGVGEHDFSSMTTEDLEAVDALLRSRGTLCVLTIYVSHDKLEWLRELVFAYSKLRSRGGLRNIVGLATEGPLLGSVGGIPQKGSWVPTKAEWERLLELGPHGLRYMVISPDAMGFGLLAPRERASDQPDVHWVFEALARAGVKPALGHFQRSNPEGSARCIGAALDCIERMNGGADRDAVLTDHLFNDMPLTFRHAWRTESARALRERELQQKAWSWESLDADVGVVPAAIMRAARDGRLSACLNFDGEHVDAYYCAKTVRFLGAEHIMGITDHTEQEELAGEPLHQLPGSSLFWQDRGLVAAGGQGLPRQLANAAQLGLSASEIWRMFAWRPSQFFGLMPDGGESPAAAPVHASLVSQPGEWVSLVG